MEFIRFPWEVYRGDKNWVPPIVKQQKRFLSPANPFFDHGEAAYYLALRGGKICGRVAASIDHNYAAFHHEKMGCFGFFEVFNDSEVASRLLDAAHDWLTQKGMEVMRGPLNFTTREERGLLLQGFDVAPMMPSAYNPAYYVDLIESYGLKKVTDWYSYRIADVHKLNMSFLSEIAERAADNGVTARSINRKQLRTEFERIREIVKGIYDNAWTSNWGFVPLTDAEAQEMGDHLRALAVDDLVFIGEVDGRPVGFLILMPDYNVVLKKMNGKMGPVQVARFLWYRNRAKKEHVQVFAGGVLPDYQRMGVAAVMGVKAFENGIRLGYKSAEFPLALEDNVGSVTIVEMLRAERFKTHRMYQMPLSS
jgi:GNAT superfamily N-acetyltransferase